MHLPIREVARRALEAYRNNQLQFQVDPHAEACLYAGPCAIGVSLPPELRERFDKLDVGEMSASIELLIDLEEVTTDDPEGLRTLQQTHDEITRTSDRTELIARFEEFLKELAE